MKAKPRLLTALDILSIVMVLTDSLGGYAGLSGGCCSGRIVFTP